MSKQEMLEALMEFIDSVFERTANYDPIINLAFIGCEVDDGEHLHYLSGVVGDDRKYVQDAFIDMLLDMRHAESMPAIDE